jgi:S-adenosylmethionine:tRNA ribosyltransferase-isomerase
MTTPAFSLSDFDFSLPPELVAQYPLPDRASCRLMVVHRVDQRIEHVLFSDFNKYLNPGDILVINDSKVRTCRLFGRRSTGGKVEVFLLRRSAAASGVYEALISPGGRVKPGERIVFAGGALSCEILGRREVRFSTIDEEAIYAAGEIPLPPYIKRKVEPLDREYYQTVYAAENGSVAAPTAGLHFTREQLDSLRGRSVVVAAVTLHVGHATFKPVSSDDIRQHQMGTEEYSLSPSVCRALDAARASGKQICAVGTTSCRTLESYAASGKSAGATDLFIYPGNYRFQYVTMLLTNFHLPRTTLFMLVCAFAGRELAQRAYASAIEEKYRFYSYGDAMLIV